MLGFAALVPHSPLLIPAIGKERTLMLAKTLTAYQTIGQELRAGKPDSVLILTPHGSTAANDAFTLSISPNYRSNFREFGDLQTALEVKPDLHLLEALRRIKFGKSGLAIQGITEKYIDYGAAVPLYLLAQYLPDIRAALMRNAGLSARAHFKMGKHIAEVLQNHRKRVAVIASADLSHTLTDSAPGGFQPEGKKFDETVVQAIRKNEPEKIFKLENRAEKAKTCGLGVLAMLFGILRDINYAPDLLAYEGPFGVGYLTAKFNFS